MNFSKKIIELDIQKTEISRSQIFKIALKGQFHEFFRWLNLILDLKSFNELIFVVRYESSSAWKNKQEQREFSTVKLTGIAPELLEKKLIYRQKSC